MDWCLTIIDHIVAVDSAFGKIFNAEMKGNMIRLSQQNNRNTLIGCQQAYRDSIEMAQVLPLSEINRLNASLRQKFGKDLLDANKALLKRVQKSIKTNRVINEDEYDILQNYVDKIYSDPDKINELLLVNNLFAQFHLTVNH